MRGNDVDLATGVGNGDLKGRSRELRNNSDVPLIVEVADIDALCELPLVDLLRRRELDATFLQPLLGAGQAESFFRLPFACVRAAIYVQDFTCGECGLS